MKTTIEKLSATALVTLASISLQILKADNITIEDLTFSVNAAVGFNSSTWSTFCATRQVELHAGIAAVTVSSADTTDCVYPQFHFTGLDLNHAYALQAAGGYSALHADVNDDNGTSNQLTSAEVVWSIRVRNITASPIPCVFDFKIFPGQLQIYDTTIAGVGKETLRARAGFSINASIKGFNTVSNFWTWSPQLYGGRAGVSLDDGSGPDLKRIGFPLLITNWTMGGTVFTAEWDEFDGHLELGTIPAGEAATVNYRITLDAKDTADDGGGTTGASATGGDPFTLSTGDPAGVGSNLRLTAGDVVMNVPGPSRLTLTRSLQGAQQLQLKGVTGRTYVVEASTNLTNWTTVLTTNPPAMPFTWSDPAQNRSRFYRARLLP